MMIMGAMAISVSVIRIRNAPFISPFPSFMVMVNMLPMFGEFKSSGESADPGGFKKVEVWLSPVSRPEANTGRGLKIHNMPTVTSRHIIVIIRLIFSLVFIMFPAFLWLLSSGGILSHSLVKELPETEILRGSFNLKLSL